MLQHIINQKNLPHAILINESKLCEVNELLRQCQVKLGINDFDSFIRLDGYSQTIKKENIQNIIEKFNLSNYGNGNKLYAICGIESTSPQAINSLLKFLEEPPANTYAILTTRNINHVLPTIKSRCQIFTLPSNFEKLNVIAKNFNLSSEQIIIIKTIYYDWDSLYSDLKNNFFFKNYDDAKLLVENINDLKTIKDKSEDFKKMSYQNILLLLQFINYFIKPNIDLLKLIDSIKSTPSRIMIFNRLWSILENK